MCVMFLSVYTAKQNFAYSLLEILFTSFFFVHRVFGSLALKKLKLSSDVECLLDSLLSNVFCCATLISAVYAVVL